VYIPIIVLAAVFVLIAIRQVGRYNLKIWQIMLGGAIVVLLTGQITISDALHAVNMDVMLFLFGMFIVGERWWKAGIFRCSPNGFFPMPARRGQVSLFILFGIGLLSALIMNDTLAIIGTPLVLVIATKFRLSPKLMLFSLAISCYDRQRHEPYWQPPEPADSSRQWDAGTILSPLELYLLIPTLISLVARIVSLVLLP